MLKYQIEIPINNTHLDQFQHVNNVQYVSWVEMIATEHWNLLKGETKYAAFHWFLVEHLIQYKQQVFLGDVLMIKTYPVLSQGIRQIRKVEFYKNEQLVADSTTFWVLIDPVTQKIIRTAANWLDDLSTNLK